MSKRYRFFILSSGFRFNIQNDIKFIKISFIYTLPKKKRQKNKKVKTRKENLFRRGSLGIALSQTVIEPSRTRIVIPFRDCSIYMESRSGIVLSQSEILLSWAGYTQPRFLFPNTGHLSCNFFYVNANNPPEFIKGQLEFQATKNATPQNNYTLHMYGYEDSPHTPIHFFLICVFQFHLCYFEYREKEKKYQ